jgi:AraC-like DNA-binding protein
MPRSLVAHEHFFKSTPEFSQSDTGFVIQRTSSKTSGQTFVGDTFTSERLRLLLESSQGAQLSLPEAARKFAITPRTLQRRLSSEGLSYRKVVDRALAAQAMRLLSDGSQPIARIAVDLGFSEPRAFQRAFRRWTGKAPSDYLRSAAEGTEHRQLGH